MSDYNFLKSGSGNDINLSDKQILELSSLVMLFAENALKTSALYVSHAKRTIVQVKDIQKCMKLEAMMFCNTNDNIQKAKELLNDLLTHQDDDDDDDDDDDISDLIAPDDEEEFTLSKCENCPLCSIINDIDHYWSKWEPVTPLELSLKKNIDTFDL